MMFVHSRRTIIKNNDIPKNESSQNKLAKKTETFVDASSVNVNLYMFKL